MNNHVGECVQGYDDQQDDQVNWIGVEEDDEAPAENDDIVKNLVIVAYEFSGHPEARKESKRGIA